MHTVMKKRNGLFLFMSIVFLLFATGCGAGETAAAHDLKLPNSVESKLPLPKDATILMEYGEGDEHIIMFTPGISFSEAEKFFSKSFNSSGWSIKSETISDNDDGERESWWVAEGHGVTVNLSIGAFDEEDVKNIIGTIVIE